MALDGANPRTNQIGQVVHLVHRLLTQCGWLRNGAIVVFRRPAVATVNDKGFRRLKDLIFPWFILVLASMMYKKNFAS